MSMKRNFLSPLVGIALTKSQFCWCTGLSEYNLKKVIERNLKRYERLGYTRYCKLLMPSVVLQLLADTGLQIDVDLYAQYVQGQRASRVQ